MKLRNKRTGEIIDIYKGEITLHYNQGRKTIHFKRLEDLEEWEDVPEEPKEYYCVSCYCEGGIANFNRLKPEAEMETFNKSIGNYFETKEEAEKAVEKLKAWKRLKDSKIKFCLDFVMNKIVFTYVIGKNTIVDAVDAERQIFEDMKIVFGGEE